MLATTVAESWSQGLILEISRAATCFLATGVIRLQDEESLCMISYKGGFVAGC